MSSSADMFSIVTMGGSQSPKIGTTRVPKKKTPPTPNTTNEPSRHQNQRTDHEEASTTNSID